MTWFCRKGILSPMEKKYLDFENPKGWIALDIDGTITADKYKIPVKVLEYLQSLVVAGWKLVLLTGRSFYFALRAVETLPFPYLLALQNGSSVLKMPEREILLKKNLNTTSLEILDHEHKGIKGGLLIYAGIERGDFFYYKPDVFTLDDLPFLEEVKRRENPSSVACSQFDFHEIKTSPLVKTFGPKERMQSYVERLKKFHLFELTMIQDPFQKDFYFLLITDKNVTKGSALKEIVERYGRGNAVICGGDDENDYSMFEVADFAIAMQSAPAFMKKEADFIAPPVEEYGIITALSQAISKFA